MTSTDDHDQTRRLVALASSGDTAAVHELLARYHTPLEQYIRRHCGAELAQRESAADLAQSVCREALEDLDVGTLDFRGEVQFRQWLYRVALNKVRMRGRHWQAERRAAQHELPLASGDGASPAITETPSRVVGEREQEQRLQVALAGLPAPQRQLIQWARFEGLAHRDIAERLGVTEAHSRMLLARAMALLAQAMAN